MSYYPLCQFCDYISHNSELEGDIIEDRMTGDRTGGRTGDRIGDVTGGRTCGMTGDRTGGK